MSAQRQLSLAFETQLKHSALGRLCDSSILGTVHSVSQTNQNRLNGAVAVPVGEGGQGSVHTAVGGVDGGQVDLGYKSHHRRNGRVIRTACDTQLV